MALTDNIVSYWKLDESSGNAADSAGSNTATATNVSYVSAKINNGADMNGSSSTLSIGTTALVPTTSGQAISVSFWLNSDTASTNSAYRQSFSFKGGILFRWSWGDGGANYGSAVYRTVSNTYLTPNLSLSASTWYHIVIIYDGTNLKLYVNGTQSGSNIAVTAGVRYDSGTNYIGSSDSGSDFYDGRVDEFGLWSRALSGTEVTELYNSGNGLQYPFGTAYTLICAVGSFVLTGFDLVFTKTLNMLAGTGSFVLTGFNTLFQLGYGIICNVGSYILTGYDALFKSSGWRNPDNKSSSAYTNPDSKSSSTWTNRNKNS